MAGGKPARFGGSSLSIARWPRCRHRCSKNAILGRDERARNNTGQEQATAIHQCRWIERRASSQVCLFHAWAIPDSYAAGESGLFIARCQRAISKTEKL